MRVGSRSLSLSSFAPSRRAPSSREDVPSIGFGRGAAGPWVGLESQCLQSQSHKLRDQDFTGNIERKSPSTKSLSWNHLSVAGGVRFLHMRVENALKKKYEKVSGSTALLRWWSCETQKTTPHDTGEFGRASGGPRAPFDPKRTAARGPKPSRAFNWERSAERGTLPFVAGDTPHSKSPSVRQGLGRLACSARARG